MKPLEYPLLADENINPEVIRALVAEGKTVTSVLELGLSGKGDSEILENAYRRGCCVLTHDSDFGTLAIRSGAPFIGIIYLRPGHCSSAFVIETLRCIDTLTSDVDTPFSLVADRRNDTVRIRIRQGKSL